MTDLTCLTGKEQMIAGIQEMIARAKRGEIQCTAFRLFNADGTWVDIAAGGTSEQKERMLLELKSRLREQVTAPNGSAANDET